MRIQPISNNNQTQFKAVNKKYYDWAVRASKSPLGYSELLFQLKTETCFEIITKKDALDTLAKIKDLAAYYWQPSIDDTIKFVKALPLD